MATESEEGGGVILVNERNGGPGPGLRAERSSCT